jgi:hypothetical protein
MPYSSLIELVGIKDLADESPAKYSKEIELFSQELQNCAVEENEEGIELPTPQHLVIFRDSCYLQAEDLKVLIDYLKRVRRTLLLNNKQFIRGAVIKGELGVENISNKNLKEVVKGYIFGSVASRLFGHVEALKGIGILIHDEIIENVNIKELNIDIFTNYYISDSYKRKYRWFYDIAMGEEVKKIGILRTMIDSFKKARIISRKIARFYISIFLNWVEHMNLSEEVGKAHYTLDNEMRKSEFMDIKEVVGFELIYFKMMDRVYEFSKEEIEEMRKKNAKLENGEKIPLVDPERLFELEDIFLRKCKWLHKYLRHDEMEREIPKRILKGKSRRNFAMALAGQRYGVRQKKESKKLTN